MAIAVSRRRQREQTTESVHAALTAGGSDRLGTIFQLSLLASLLVALGLLVWLLASVLQEAVPYLQSRGLGEFLTGELASKPARFGVSQGIWGSVGLLAIVGLIAFPTGVATAVYLEEYARDSRVARAIMLLIRNLSGVPSVVYGILGLVVFKELLGDFTGGPSLLSGGLTMAILVLPIVVITASEAIRAVPQSLREAGFGVGANQSEVIRSHVLPYALPGILTGTVLAFARAIGEAAPILMIGAVTGLLPSANGGVWDQLTAKFTALPMIVFASVRKPASEGWPGVAAATILVLLVVLLIANTTAIVVRNRVERKRQS